MRGARQPGNRIGHQHRSAVCRQRADRHLGRVGEGGIGLLLPGSLFAILARFAFRARFAIPAKLAIPAMLGAD